MKKLALILIIAALFTFMSAAVVSADDKNWMGFHGEYAMTSAGFCLFSDNPFTPGSQACDGSDTDNLTCWGAQVVADGVWSFGPRGMGSFTGHQYGMAPPPFAFANVLPVDLEFDFTYTVTNDGKITAAIVPGTFWGTWMAGGRTGKKYTVDIFNFHGMVSSDRKTVTLNSANELQHYTTPDFPPETWWYGICNISRTLIRVDNQ
jgi:hypothetical protein